MTRTAHAAFAACTLTLASLCTVPAAAQTGFEGVVTFAQHNKTDGKTSTMIQTTKGNKVRLEGFESGSTMILDGDSHTMIIVEPEKKQYMTVTQADMEQMAAMMKPMAERMKAREKGEAKDSFKVDVKNTGRTETVAGRKCEVWAGSSTDEDGKTRQGEACVAQGVGLAMYDLMVNNPMAKQMRGSAQAQLEKFKKVMSGGKGVLKMTSIENGKPFVELEATKIEPKRVSDDAFKPPADYTGTTMAGMMQQAAQQMQLMKQKMQEKGAGKP